MKNKKILSVMTAALFALALTGCYEKHTGPAVQSRYDDEWFTGKGYAIVPVQTIKDMFEDPGNELIDHLVGVLEGYSGTRSIPGASPTILNTYGRYYEITEKYVIKGKVTSNDAFGNVYRSLFIQDDEGVGIEVKVGLNGMYTKYLVGETVYVICEGLALGNYRSMLSLGIKPQKEDRSDSSEPYANKYMEVKQIVDEHVFLGAKTALTDDDIVVIGAGQSLTDAQFTALGGKLARIEGLVSSWTSGQEGYPNFLHKHGVGNYSVYSFLYAMEQWEAYRAGGSVGDAPIMPEPKNNYIDFEDPDNPGQLVHLPTWGFQEYGNANATYNFGSALFTKSGYTGTAEINIRTSGYARFALRPVTPDGKTVNVTGIITRYTSKNNDRYVTYQITVNNVDDIVQID